MKIPLGTHLFQRLGLGPSPLEARGAIVQDAYVSKQ